MKSVFNQSDVSELINRINKLSPTTKPQWGTMNIAQALAHCNVTYELVYDNIHPKPNGFKKLLLRMFVKKYVVTEKPFKRNGPTGPEFVVKVDKNFDVEKKRLVDYIHKTQQLGEKHFAGKESQNFGVLNSNEWNTMFYKHLDHHLTQFGV
jgi:hypothetical protein